MSRGHAPSPRVVACRDSRSASGGTGRCETQLYLFLRMAWTSIAPFVFLFEGKQRKAERNLFSLAALCARVLRAPVFLCSLTWKTWRCSPHSMSIASLLLYSLTIIASLLKEKTHEKSQFGKNPRTNKAALVKEAETIRLLLLVINDDSTRAGDRSLLPWPGRGCGVWSLLQPRKRTQR